MRPRNLALCALLAGGCRQVLGLDDLPCIPAYGGAAAYATGTGPSAVITVDLDGNGHLDVVTANPPANSLSRLLGNGDGTLGDKSDDANALEAPSGVRAGDFNRDGVADLVLLSEVDGGLGVLLGDGTGTFAPTTLITVAEPVMMDVGNLDGVRGDDIAVLSRNGQVSVLLANADGTFAAAVTYPSSSANVLKLADMTRDGSLDIVLTISGDPGATASPVVVLPNNRDGAYGDAVTSMTPAPLATLAIGDVDEDDIPDVLVGSSSTSGYDMRVGKGIGDGSFVFGEIFDVFGRTPTELVDLDGDEILDAVLTNRGSTTPDIVVRQGRGDGTFAGGVGTFPLPGVAQNVTVGQLDGGGVVDVIATLSTNEVAVLVGTCTYATE